METEIKFDAHDAVKTALENDDIKKMLSDENMMLSSAFLLLQPKNNVIDNWIINIFNRETRNITSVYLRENSLDIREPSPQANKKEIKPIDINKVSVRCRNALDLAVEENEKHIGKSENSKIFITLHNNEDHERECWTISFLSPNLSAHTIKIDASDGAIVSSDIRSLMDGAIVKKKESIKKNEK